MRREPKRHGKPSTFSGLRIVLSATAITIAILLLAFGALGMLTVARAPQEPLANKFDPPLPVVAQNEPKAIPAPMPAPEAVPEQTALTDDPLLVPAPEQVPFVTQAEIERQEAALPAQVAAEDKSEPEAPVAAAEPQKPEADSETTASIPSSKEEPEAKEEPDAEEQPVAAPKKRNVRRSPPRQRVVRRPYQKKAAETQNPLLQLFGIKQYR